MKIFYDTEFLEDGRTIELLSIGMVREDGKSYYGVIADPFLITQASHNEWLRKNVLDQLPYREYPGDVWDFDSGHDDYKKLKFRWVLREEVKTFIMNTPDPELWAYYGAYDHVVMCQLFGRMIDLPRGIPMYTNDLMTEIKRAGSPRLPNEPEGIHNALTDAKWNKETYEHLQALRTASEGRREALATGV